MFSNPCIGELSYEGTAAAILMAGLFVSFFIEYAAHRIADKCTNLVLTVATSHRINARRYRRRIFITLSIVIVFHQAFEGIALGSCIASLGRPAPHTTHAHGHSHSHHFHATSSSSDTWSDEDARTNTTASDPASSPVPLRKKLLLASGFALVTPLGMAIGICALHRFNGNDPATIWAIGSLDAFSAGILVWVGIVEMWAGDWMLGGCMAHASRLVAGLGLAALVSGMALMSFLGKWA
ncbi:unnamed protein product [Parascedosporium putredinis]|uniref:Zinc/iron permease n=1 Tax=Parascedosporium putredinis TaxID=1442378 RepID=A0A9P1H2E4_9PEZI|nr:unnamed protein product [Parascedosporium putredinis]CAI7993586.1 unnamed protein product [Parascedosporium putredinis]